ncbi:hypothetical protein [Sphingomonas sp. S2-65]|uniref:hypothetical protein n=1 Tax=Sphingomonas sp. S2-65 TaxID=2903960 RepID=UPI001F44919C|nr:hypothetical protein [Sphingomonas sp. S2-65]UYY60095.1 hypothetical protein LZ586_08465 [Sphingomonas sp. S2-65]
MSADGGLVLMIFGAVALLTSVTERVVAHRRWLESRVETVLDPALRAAFPPPPIAPDLQRLVLDAASVLDSQELTRERRRWLRRGGRTARGR